MNLLQQAFTIKVDFKKIVPSITQFNSKTFVQYDIGNRHIRFELEDDQLEVPATYRVVTSRAKGWALGDD